MKIRVKNPYLGVPITFIDKYCPDQFIIGGGAAGNTSKCGFNYEVTYIKHHLDKGGCGVINGTKRTYSRIFIRKK